MVTMQTNQKFSVAVTPVLADGVTHGAIDAPPTYPVDVAGVVNVVVAADGLSAVVNGVAVGTCVITPTALANAVVITGAPIQVVVTAVPVPFATQLIETVGPVVAQ